jgi:hypothetical protein
MIKHLYAVSGRCFLPADGSKPSVQFEGMPSRVTDEDGAVRFALEGKYQILRTHEVYADTQKNDKGQDIRLWSDACNHAWSMVGFDRVYGRGELLDEVRARPPHPARLADTFDHYAPPVPVPRAAEIKYLLSRPADAMFVYHAERGPIPLEAGNKVFDRKGRHIWTQSEAPAPAPALAARTPA